MKAVLTVTGGPQSDRQWTIDSGAPLTIGRGDHADIVLLDAEVSRIHCRISWSNGRWYVQDDGSLNGTFVNGKRTARSELRHGDRLRVGSTTIRVDIAEAEAGKPTMEGPLAAAAPGVASSEPTVIRRPPTVVAPGKVSHLPPPRIVRMEREETVEEFVRKHPRDASNIVLTRRQKLWYLLVALVLVGLLVRDLLYFLHIVQLLCTFYLVVIAYKLITVLLSVVWRWEIGVSKAEVAALRDDLLPIYTILVPLYKESEVANKIVRYISELDYPKDKLDVKILLEPDDPQTLDAIRQTGLPEFCEVIICPDSRPKTKPKACNHGLARARGEYVVIYDAEDRPEPDQLRKAVVGFRIADARRERWNWLRRFIPFRRADRGRTVCLQAKLGYYNPRQNLLTRWFTIEYATWFQLYLPGLHALRAPIPLGGTSNHFRTDVLREIGGWDPFNVTEDCDLGIRIHKRGYRTQVLDSTTWEEANSRLGNWVRQRSRWVKGYIQTHFTHMRHPLRTLWQLRPWGMFNFLNSVGGLSLMLLLNPIFWAVTMLYASLFAMDLYEHDWSIERSLGVNQAFEDAADVDVRRDRTVRIPHPDRWAWPMVCCARPHALPDDATWQEKLRLAIQEDWKQNWQEAWVTHSGFHFWNRISLVFFFCTVALLFGNLFFVLMHVFACVRARAPGLIPLAFLMPFYWVLISIAAWKGFLQLFRRPFYWEKTRHGLDVKAGKPA